MAHLTNLKFLFKVFMKLSQKMPLYFFNTMVQKGKNDQNFKSRRGTAKKGEIGILKGETKSVNFWQRKV